MFRVVKIDEKPKYTPHIRQRVPINIPYIVDNIWEWLRKGQPSRRASAFAYATYRQAKNNLLRHDQKIVQIELPEKWPVAQIVRGVGREDAKNHQDIRKIPEFMIEIFGDEWLKSGFVQRGDASALFSPCLPLRDISALMEKIGVHDARMREVSSFWEDIEVTEFGILKDDQGEIFFEIPPVGYRVENVGE